MLTAIPLTVIPLILYAAIGSVVGGDPWSMAVFTIDMVSGRPWSLTLHDLVVLFALLMLFFETLRSAAPARPATIANHIISTIVLVVYIVVFLVVPFAADSLFFVLTVIALFDVVAGFTISIRTAQRDVTLGTQSDVV